MFVKNFNLSIAWFLKACGNCQSEKPCALLGRALQFFTFQVNILHKKAGEVVCDPLLCIEKYVAQQFGII